MRVPANTLRRLNGVITTSTPLTIFNGRTNNMKNLQYEISKNLLTITVDLSKTCGRSKTGKTTIVATTEGNILLEDGKTFLGVNVYRK